MTDDPEIAPLDPVGVEPQQPALNFRKRLEELGQMALLVFILASAAFLSAITAMRIAIHDRVNSELPINVVVRQTPPAGLLMKESQQAHVVLSLGQRQLRIPLLEGNSLRASRIELLRAGLQVGEVTAITMPEKPADEVVIQAPPRRQRPPPQSKLRLRSPMAPRRRNRPVPPGRLPPPRRLHHRPNRRQLNATAFDSPPIHELGVPIAYPSSLCFRCGEPRLPYPLSSIPR